MFKLHEEVIDNINLCLMTISPMMDELTDPCNLWNKYTTTKSKKAFLFQSYDAKMLKM